MRATRNEICKFISGHTAAPANLAIAADLVALIDNLGAVGAEKIVGRGRDLGTVYFHTNAGLLGIDPWASKLAAPFVVGMLWVCRIADRQGAILPFKIAGCLPIAPTLSDRKTTLSVCTESNVTPILSLIHI